MSSRVILIGATLVLGLGVTGAASAGDKAEITFAPGRSSATIKGEIQGMDRDVYPITAQGGQTLRVAVANSLKLVLFHIQRPGGDERTLPKAGPDDDATQWQGILPVSGTYKIIVGAMRGADSRYTLSVQVTGPAAKPPTAGSPPASTIRRGSE